MNPMTVASMVSYVDLQCTRAALFRLGGKIKSAAWQVLLMYVILPLKP